MRPILRAIFALVAFCVLMPAAQAAATHGMSLFGSWFEFQQRSLVSVDPLYLYVDVEEARALHLARPHAADGEHLAGRATRASC